MNDTINKIKLYLLEKANASSSEIHAFLSPEGAELSLVTTKRLLTSMAKEGVLVVSGKGPATKYKLSIKGTLFAPIDAKAYCAEEPDTRIGRARYNHELFSAITEDLFTQKELELLEAATKKYSNKIPQISETAHQKELERFVIELSWKSSKIEGNTYTLLDTERLIKNGIEAVGHAKDEATMILNHKEAFSYINENKKQFLELSRKNIEEVHSLLVKDLPIARNFRTGLVGVVGSKYRPLDTFYQIIEAIEDLVASVGSMPNGYAKSLMTLLGLSYVQPFEDGNKRTARLMGNAVLLAYGLSPLSYRSVNEEEYREATLVFYELNSLESFKKLFIEQYIFAAETYAL
jgi:Fic family protein